MKNSLHSPQVDRALGSAVGRAQPTRRAFPSPTGPLACLLLLQSPFEASLETP